MSQRNPDDYEVGYKKPPKSTQFQKGHSGFKGRNRSKQRPIEDVLIQELSKTIAITENGKRSKVTRLEAIVKKNIASLMTSGDLKGLTKLIKILPAGKLEESQKKEEAQQWFKELFESYVQGVRGYYSYLRIKKRLGMDPHDFVDMMLAEWDVDTEQIKVESPRRYAEYLTSPAARKRPNYAEKIGLQRDTFDPNQMYPDQPPPWESGRLAQ